MDELSLVFVRRDAMQEAPGPFVAGLAGPSHSRRGVLAGGPPDAPGVDGLFGRGVWRCCRIRAWCHTILAGENEVLISDELSTWGAEKISGMGTGEHTCQRSCVGLMFYEQALKEIFR